MNPSSQALVSAVVPVYNGEAYLHETIESVLAQSYPNIECLVINDGSTDGSRGVAQAFGDRIRYFEKPNGGVSSARNLGISESKGELIAFLDADDLWLSDKIEKQVACFVQSPDLGLNYTSVQIVNEDKEVLSIVELGPENEALRSILLMETPTYLTMTGVVRREVFDEIGVFDESLSTSADADMACRIALRYELKVINEPLAMYRQHSNQMHHNLEALEHDANILFSKNFNGPNIPKSLVSIKSKAYSNLEITLAIGYVGRNEYARSMRHLGRAIVHDPVNSLRKILVLGKNRLLRK